MNNNNSKRTSNNHASETAVCRRSIKQCSKKFFKNSQESTCGEFLVLIKLEAEKFVKIQLSLSNISDSSID